MAWIFEPAVDAFEHHRRDWDELNASIANQIVLDSVFVQALLRHFGTRETVLGISTNARFPGMVVLDRVKPGFVNTFHPSQAPIGLFLLANNRDVLGQMDDLIRCLPRHVLGVAILQQDPDYTVFRHAEVSARIRRIEYIRTARVSLQDTFDAYWGKRQKGFVSDLARQRRKLMKEGKQLEILIERNPRRIDECLREYGRLEATGWKGREGTAVSVDNAQGAFYREILETFCRRGEGVVYRLVLDGKTVACELCIERGHTLIDLKTAYDETVRGYSLGSLLEEEMLKSYYGEGYLKEVEFYGRVSDWTRKWTDEIRPIYHYNIYRYGWIAGVHARLRGASGVGRDERAV